MANGDPPSNRLTGGQLEAEYQRLLAALPVLFLQAQQTLQATRPLASISGVIVRNYTTYSAYEDPIGD